MTNTPPRIASGPSLPAPARAASSPFVPSPVALAMLALFRRLRRAVTGPAGSGATRPVVTMAALAGLGLYLSIQGSDPEPAPGPIDGPIAGPTPASGPQASPGGSARVPDPTPSPPPVAGVDAGSRADVVPESSAPEREPVAGSGPGSAPGSDGGIPVERHERLVREKEELEARVAALEIETTALESEMLALDLQVLVMETATRDADVEPDAVGGAGGREPDASVPSAPIELGNATLVPAPLSGIASGGVRDVPFEGGGFGGDAPPASSEPFLPTASLDGDAIVEPAYTGTLPPSAVAAPGDGGSARASASASVGVPVERVVVTEVPVGSSAADAGILPGDVLLAVDGRPVVELDDLYPYVNGDPAPLHELELLRDDRRQWVDLASSPADLSLSTRWIDPARLVVD